MATPPLHGLRVLDCSRLLPGPACSRMLADLGATVLRIDHPDPRRGDLVRALPPYARQPKDERRAADEQVASPPAAVASDAGDDIPPTPGDDRGLAFIGLNHGKHSVRLDLSTPDGRDAFLHLAAGADVVLESFRPGVLDRHGCGWEAIHAANPQAILCSITGFGQSGPDAERAGHDLGYLARAGVLGVSGEPDRAPLPLGVQVADLAGGALPGVIGILAALRERDGSPGAPGSGLGQHVDVSMTDGARALLALDGTTALSGRTLAPRGRSPLSGAGIACYRTYACSDGYVTLGAVEPKFWQAWCEGVGRPELGAAQGAAPGSPEASEVEAIFAARSRDEWTAFGREHDCCLEPVLTPAEALAEPPAATGAPSPAGFEGALPPSDDAIGPNGEPIAVPLPGLRFSRSPLAPAGRAPQSGADDRALLNDRPWDALS